MQSHRSIYSTFINPDHIPHLQTAELQEDTQQSLRGWYVVGARAGEFDPKTHYVTTNFFSARNQVSFQFLFKSITKETEEILLRKVSYHHDWEVEQENYLGTIHDLLGSINVGIRKAWQNDSIQPGYLANLTHESVYMLYERLVVWSV